MTDARASSALLFGKLLWIDGLRAMKLLLMPCDLDCFRERLSNPCGLVLH